ncbi:MAG: hypothetical protein N3G19_02615 [Candidatus Pacearchaeota archaeon]|nr:hypothetical protein [Candidatus Pacearchaeota archaeon]
MKEKKRQRMNIIIGIIIAFLMIASVIGYALLESYQGEEGQTAKYRNYKFIKTENGWQTQIKVANQLITINTYHLPQEVENISSEGKPLLADFLNKVIFIVATTETERQAAFEYNNFGAIALRMQLACSPENENSSFCVENNLPLKSCEDADWQTTIIKIKETENETSVNYKNSCLEIKGKATDLIKANEKAIFMTFGIIE